MAAVHWGAAQWPIHSDDEVNRFHHERKRACYARYAELADHRIEAVTSRSRAGPLPAWFHLPPGYHGGRLPVVIVVPGMDSFKEATVALHGDRFLTRGFAVLAIEGPGQYECRDARHPLQRARLGAVPAPRAWTGCPRREEVDPERIVLSGSSFGSFAGDHRRRARAPAEGLRAS